MNFQTRTALNDNDIKIQASSVERKTKFHTYQLKQSKLSRVRPIGIPISIQLTLKLVCKTLDTKYRSERNLWNIKDVQVGQTTPDLFHWLQTKTIIITIKTFIKYKKK